MLNSGEVIIFPTDTVYGIGASAFDKKAQDKIYDIKRRPESKRLSILCASVNDIEKIAYVTDDARKLISKYMPGGLTLILKTKEEVVSESIHETVGVRIPNSKIALSILRETGPLANSSVNYSGEAPLNDYSEIVKEFGDKVSKVYPTNEISSNVSSTVINMTTNPISLIREGSIKFKEILDYLK